ncbi:hypothetical protein EDB80DRAFT_867654 [Ilyonectria destructans]|nr:hypothetical protein EDB80DRAFT_693693 [Ilyonectria destructans]KAH7002662.1 hypothetical protein EDB80DRAFT_867654 [Ilyonectria destructans]
MGLSHLPPEILSQILAYLVEPSDFPEAPEIPDFVLDLCAARLVCGKWNGLGTTHLYRTLALRRVKDASYLERWHNLLDLQTARQAVQHVIIHAGLDHIPHRPDYALWVRSGRAKDVAFTSAIDRIVDLPNLSGLSLQFTDDDWIVLDDSDWDGHLILKGARINTFRAVVNAMVSRTANPNNVAIRSLTIVNLPGRPIPDVTCSDFFKKAIRDIRCLHLHITSTNTTLSHHYHDRFNKELRQFVRSLDIPSQNIPILINFPGTSSTAGASSTSGWTASGSDIGFQK